MAATKTTAKAVATPEFSTPESPAPAAPAVKRTKTTAPAFDYGNLQAVDAPQPVKTGAVGSDENPAIAWVKSSLVRRESLAGGSWRGVGKSITIPAANATQAEGLLRKAARTIGAQTGESIGVAIQRVDEEGGKVTIRFAAKKGKEYRARKTA